MIGWDGFPTFSTEDERVFKVMREQKHKNMESTALPGPLVLDPWLVPLTSLTMLTQPANWPASGCLTQLARPTHSILYV